jgi:ribonuclease Y
MSPIIIASVALAMGLVLGLVAGTVYSRHRSELLVESAEKKVERILVEAETAAKETLVQARDEAIQLRNEAEQEYKRQERELRQEDSRLQRRRASLDERFEQLDKRERTLSQRQSALDKRYNQLEKLEKDRLDELQRVANLSQEEAKDLLLETVEQDARQDMARIIREVEAEATEEAERRARKIVTLAIQRIASEQVSEISVSTVPLPSDEMKGRIIGRQGRNIRALENARLCFYPALIRCDGRWLGWRCPS